MIESPIVFNGLTLNDQSIRNPSRKFLGTVAVTHDSDQIQITSSSFDEYNVMAITLDDNPGAFIDHAIFIPEHEPFIVIAYLGGNIVRVDRPVPALTGTYPVEVWHSEPYLRVSEVTGLDDADVRYESQEISGSDGENPSETLYGGRSVTVSFQIRAWNFVQLRFWEDRIKGAFGDLQDHPFEYTPRGQKTRTLRARKSQKLDITDVQDGPLFWRNVVVGLRASDPLAVVTDNVSQIINEFGTPKLFQRYDILPTPPDTFRKRDYPRVYSPSSEFDPSYVEPRTVTHRGNYRAWPTSRLYGPMTNPRIRNTTINKTIEFSDLVIDEGSFIEIEHRTGIIRWYGTTETYTGLDIVNSEFWWLASGANSILLDADAFSPESGAKLVLSWQDTYL